MLFVLCWFNVSLIRWIVSARWIRLISHCMSKNHTMVWGPQLTSGRVFAVGKKAAAGAPVWRRHCVSNACEGTSQRQSLFLKFLFVSMAIVTTDRLRPGWMTFCASIVECTLRCVDSCSGCSSAVRHWECVSVWRYLLSAILILPLYCNIAVWQEEIMSVCWCTLFFMLIHVLAFLPQWHL